MIKDNIYQIFIKISLNFFNLLIFIYFKNFKNIFYQNMFYYILNKKLLIYKKYFIWDLISKIYYKYFVTIFSININLFK